MTLSVDEFREWLEFQHPGEIVGDSYEVQSCPIASWIERENERVRASVHTHFVQILYRSTGRHTRLGLPGWARRFIRELDDRFGDNHEVTREEALAVLDAVTAPAAGKAVPA